MLFQKKIRLFNSPETFEKIYQRYAKKLIRITANQVNDISVVEDIVQNVFCRLWERRDEVFIEKGIENYLVRAVKLAILDHIRLKTIHSRHHSLIANTKTTESNETESLLNAKEIKSLIQRSTAKLPEKCRIVYDMSRDKDMSNKQIAQYLGISEKTVEAHISKAIKHLRSDLSEFI